MALADNILNYWKTDESSGNAADSAGAVTLTNTSVTYATGKINNGAVFNGAAKLAGTVADPDAYSAGYSWAFWAKVTTPTFGTTQALMQIVESASWGTCICQIVAVTGNIEFKFGNGEVGYTGTNTGQAAPAGTWFHVVMTVAAKVQKLYYNGTLISNVTKANDMANNSTTFTIGQQADGFLPLTGSMDEIGIWSRALTQTDVDQLYNGGAGNQYPFPTTAVKTVNGLARASVKTVQGLASASVKNMQGLA